MRQAKSFVLCLLAASVLGIGCANHDGPMGPSGPGPVGGSSVSLRVISGETGAPVPAGTTVSAGGQTKLTDGSGTVVFDKLVARESINVYTTGFVARNTLYRGDQELSLMPDRAGFDQTFRNEAMFWIREQMYRPDRPVTLVLSAEIWNNPDARANFQSAASRMAFRIASSSPSDGSIEVKVAINPAIAANGNAGATSMNYVNNKVVGGKVDIVSPTYARNSALVLHELGHVFGLGHHHLHGLMNPSTLYIAGDFVGIEMLAMQLMNQRMSGTRGPDDDRLADEAGARSRSTETVTTSCQAR